MDNLRSLREANNVSQQKLAESFNMTQQSVYKYENELAEPDLLTLRQFAEFFHTSVDYLIGYTTDSRPYSEMSTDVHTKSKKLSLNEIHHLKMYRNLSGEMQDHFDRIIESVVPEDSNNIKSE